MSSTAGEWGIRAVSAVGSAAQTLVGPPNDGKFAVLTYHRIAKRVSGLPKPTLNVSPSRFERQIRGLVDRGFEFWSLRRVLTQVAQGERLPNNLLVLTFDDGFHGVYASAWPFLRSMRVPATVFLNTAYLNRQEPFPFDHWGQRYAGRAPEESYRPLTVDQCVELSQGGLIEFGAHTHCHDDFRGRPEAFRADLRMNVAVITSLFGTRDVTFAFPFGSPQLGFTAADLIAAAKAEGVLCGLTTDCDRADPAADPFGWGRFHVFDWDNAATLGARLGGWYRWAPRARRRMRVWLGRPVRDVAAARPRFAVDRSGVLETDDGRDRGVANHTPRISVIVPTFDRAEWLRDALVTLMDQDTDEAFEYEVVVVDNASSDHSRRVVEQASLSASVPVRYVHEETPGDAAARNTGVAAARGEWFAFFDDDQSADRRWLCELYRAARETGANIVGGPVLLDLPEERVARLGAACRRALREVQCYDRLHLYEGQHLPGGGNALVARSVFEAIGPFDAGMTRGGSDVDFFTRARHAGMDLWYTPDAVIRHRVPPARLSPEYLRWDAMSGGAEHAGYFDYEQRGLGSLLVRCAARVGYAALISGPLLVLAHLRKDSQEALGRRIALWRTEGYVRRTLAILAPRLFPQRKFFDSLEFRYGRILSGPSGKDAAL